MKELDVAGYTSSVSALENGKITVTNTRKTGSLIIKKNVTVNGKTTTGTEADGTYEFIIRDSSGAQARTAEITISNGVSDTELVDNLPTGTYTVEEDPTCLAEGVYLLTDPVTVEVTEGTANIPTAEFTNNRILIKIQKVDINNGDSLGGAHLQVLDKNGTVVDQWDSTLEPHTVEGLEVGQEYTLRETIAPKGYTVTTDRTITIDADGKVTYSGTVSTVNNRSGGANSSEDEILLVQNDLTRVKVQKVDIATGEELTGAHIQIKDKEGKVVDEWDSVAGTPHVVTRLIVGEEYTLCETVAPTGYDITADTHFVIQPDGTVVSGDTTIRDGDGVLLVEDSACATTATVRKIWDDDDNRDGLRPKALQVELLADGEATGLSVTLNDGNHWMATLKNLNRMKGDKEIVYTWKEPTVSGYTLTSQKADGGTLTTLTNVHGPEKTEISVKKVWNDNNDSAKTRPASIKVQLYADGIGVGAPVMLEAGNNWSYTWTGLDKNTNENGASRAIRYTVAETEIPEGYSCKITGSAEKGFVITNSRGRLVIEKTFGIESKVLPPEDEDTTDIEVEKIWVGDNDNADGNRPESITVHLYAGGKEIKSAKLTAKNGWKKHWGELPKFVDGHPIHYSVSEDPVQDYVTEIRGFTIYNKYQPERTQVSVRKIWNDDNDRLKIRPTSIWMKLNNGMSVVLNEDNGWQATITGLPVRVNGKPAEYTWTEQSVMGYELESKTTEGSVTVFQNKPWTRPDAPSQGKRPKTAGDTYYVFQEYDTPLGVEIVINHVGDCFD